MAEFQPLDDATTAQLVDYFFDSVPFGLAVFDREFRLQRANRTWVGYFEKHLGVGADYVAPGRSLFDLIPGNAAALEPLVSGVLAGRVIRQQAHRLEGAGSVAYWDVVFAPLFTDGEVTGVVDIVTDATDRVVAFERLHSRIGAFTDVAAGMTVDQSLAQTLRTVMETALAQVGAVGGCLVSWAGEELGDPVVYASAGMPDGYAEAVRKAVSRRQQLPSVPRFELMRDFRREGLSLERLSPLWPYWRNARWDDLVAVPLSSQGARLGELHLYLSAGAQISTEDEQFLTALADQAAVAAQNAASYGSASQRATRAERQRLARDLHDSVTQALFAMTLQARTSKRHLSVGNTDGATIGLAAVEDLAAGALAEMRALIFELRPEALAEEGLVSALTKQAAALTARERVPITVSAPPTRPVLDLAVEENLYRLVLEAVHNSLKHAAPSAITVSVRCAESVLTLEVCDDGVGFDPAAVRAGGYGQHTMRDRAAAIGACLVVDTAPGAGCRIRVTAPV